MNPIKFPFIAVAVASVAAAEFHVSPDGDDGAAGTVAAPLATLARARDLAREAAEPGTHIVLHPGVHRLAAPLELDARDAGTTWRRADTGERGARCVISGGAPVTGWIPAGDGLWTAASPPTRELFRDGVRLRRSRHPDQGWFRIESAAADNRSGFTAAPGDLPRSVAGAELLFLHDWSTTRVAVESHDPATRVLRAADPIGCAAAHYAITHFEKRPRYAIENLPPDAEGEWAHRDGKLVLRSSTPIDPADRSIVRPRLEQLLNVHDTSDIVFRGLSFRHCAWGIPAGGFASGQACVHERRDGSDRARSRVFVPAAVRVDRARGVRFEDCGFESLGGGGLWIRERCSGSEVAGCDFRDISGNGLMIGEERSRGPEETTADIVVRDCDIRDCGVQFHGAVGVWVGMAARVRIVGNEIRDLPYTGVSLGWRWNPRPSPCREHLVASNHIHHVMQILSDGGGVYTLGAQPGTVLRDNRIHDIPVNLGRAESNGMFLDQGSTHLLITGNHIHSLPRSPLRFHQAGVNRVEDNRLITAPGVPMIRYNNTDPENIAQARNRSE